MFNWYHKNAPKNTITRYLSKRYSLEELENLTQLELPDNFESGDYANELTEICQDSPWNISEVQYQTSSFSSLKGVFSKDYWFGKKAQNQAESYPTMVEDDNPEWAETSAGKENKLTWKDIHHHFAYHGYDWETNYHHP